jgi:hypothetical protein
MNRITNPDNKIVRIANSQRWGKHIITIISLYVLLTQAAYAQSFQWAKGYGGTMPEGGYGIFTDQAGNNYITGSFRSSTAYFGNDSIFCNGWSNIYILKTDINGNTIWLKKAGGNDINYGSGAGRIIKNNNGNLFISGTFYYSIFDTIYLPSNGLNDGFLAKYNDNGSCLWVKKMGGNNDDYSSGVCIDLSQNIYVCGNFTSSVASIDTFTLTGGATIKEKIFLAKYDTTGNCLWAKQSTSGYGSVKKIIYNNAKIYMTGFFGDSLTIGGIILLENLSQPLFISSFDTNGNIKWLHKEGGTGSIVVGNSICSDNYGNLYITGLFMNTAVFGTQTIISASPQGDIFIAKYDTAGNFIWVKQLNSSGWAEGKDIIPDGNNGFYVTGFYSGSALFGSYSMTALTSRDMFIAHYGSTGNCLGVRSAANATGFAISLDTGGNCIITGSFTNSTRFDGTNLTSHGSGDIFLAKVDKITRVANRSSENNQLIIYANPNTGKCRIIVPDDFLAEINLTLCVYDNIGRLIQKQNLSLEGDKIQLSLEAEATGIYTATLSNGKKVYTGRIVFE